MTHAYKRLQLSVISFTILILNTGTLKASFFEWIQTLIPSKTHNQALASLESSVDGHACNEAKFVLPTTNTSIKIAIQKELLCITIERADNIISSHINLDARLYQNITKLFHIQLTKQEKESLLRLISVNDIDDSTKKNMALTINAHLLKSQETPSIERMPKAGPTLASERKQQYIHKTPAITDLLDINALRNHFLQERLEQLKKSLDQLDNNEIAGLNNWIEQELTKSCNAIIRGGHYAYLGLTNKFEHTPQKNCVELLQAIIDTQWFFYAVSISKSPLERSFGEGAFLVPAVFYRQITRYEDLFKRENPTLSTEKCFWGLYATNSSIYKRQSSHCTVAGNDNAYGVEIPAGSLFSNKKHLLCAAHTDGYTYFKPENTGLGDPQHAKEFLKAPRSTIERKERTKEEYKKQFEYIIKQQSDQITYEKKKLTIAYMYRTIESLFSKNQHNQIFMNAAQSFLGKLNQTYGLASESDIVRLGDEVILSEQELLPIAEYYHNLFTTGQVHKELKETLEALFVVERNAHAITNPQHKEQAQRIIAKKLTSIDPVIATQLPASIQSILIPLKNLRRDQYDTIRPLISSARYVHNIRQQQQFDNTMKLMTTRFCDDIVKFYNEIKTRSLPSPEISSEKTLLQDSDTNLCTMFEAVETTATTIIPFTSVDQATLIQDHLRKLKAIALHHKPQLQATFNIVLPTIKKRFDNGILHHKIYAKQYVELPEYQEHMNAIKALASTYTTYIDEACKQTNNIIEHINSSSLHKQQYQLHIQECLQKIQSTLGLKPLATMQSSSIKIDNNIITAITAWYTSKKTTLNATLEELTIKAKKDILYAYSPNHLKKQAQQYSLALLETAQTLNPSSMHTNSLLRDWHKEHTAMYNALRSLQKNLDDGFEVIS